MPGDPFDLDLPTDTPLRRAAAVAARPLLHWALRLNALGELYDRAIAPLASGSHDGKRDPLTFAAATLGALEVRTTCDAEPATEIPCRGPLIVAANHPHGALDGLVLLDLIGHIRPDVRLVANYLLARIPELRPLCFFVDPFEGHDSIQRNLAGARAAHLWLRQGGALIVFPAGEVGHQRRPDGSVVDSRWRSTVGRLALSTGARVVPAHIDGVNSRLFYLAGRIHPLLRTVLLPRELLNSRGRSVVIRLGHAVSANQLVADRQTADRVTERIRDAVEQIRLGSSITEQHRTGRPRPLASPIDPASLADDVRQLPVESRLATSGDFDVHCAEAAQIPHVLGEIGRLREGSFRAVGEGTGNPSDLDTFDTRYLHLFAWNRQSREVVGAYRIGRADLIMASAGVQGLYTRTLFRYDEALLDRLPAALELGRSFVRPEYQRGHNALLLLWKGICAYVQRHPQYRVLFGAVSISARYTDRTREMLMRFLEQNHLHQQLAELVSSLRPAPESRRQDPNPSSGGVPRTIEEAHTLVCQFERDSRGMPVLLRQYLKLNARVLGFSVDASFGDVLDALMMVDLLQVDARILRRYFGTAGARAFIEYHMSRSHAA